MVTQIAAVAMSAELMSPALVYLMVVEQVLHGNDV
jgi:hypothetical protein